MLGFPHHAAEKPMALSSNEDFSLPAPVRRLLPAFSGQPLGPLLTQALRALARRRPEAFERLGTFGKARYLIDPTDLPFAFHVVPDGRAALVSATDKSGTAACDVVIRGPILLLLGILDGTLDGDALFFHRAISVSGRTEAIVALRNAIEDAELRPSDLLGLSGALAHLADTGILGGLSLARQIATGAHRRERTGS
jgi:predicted lipid carrier protein YhbT